MGIRIERAAHPVDIDITYTVHVPAGSTVSTSAPGHVKKGITHYVKVDEAGDEVPARGRRLSVGALGGATTRGGGVMAAERLIAVVGADGFVGGGLSRALGARRVVYGPTTGDDVHVSGAEALIRKADVVINCGGFRVRPGCSWAEYRQSHQGATSAFVPWLKKGALLVHTSSASVLGKGVGLGNESPPNPGTFPSPGYATAKIEEDHYLEKASVEGGFRVIFLRPAV